LPNRTQILHVLKRLFFILTGFTLACIASAILVYLITSGGAPKKPDMLGIISEIVSTCSIMALFIAIYAALPSAVMILIGETTMTRGKIYYIVAGSLIGGLLPLLVGVSELALFGLLFGPIAGLIYWRVAGRNAGLWQPKAA
jgi:hypothetical protein